MIRNVRELRPIYDPHIPLLFLPCGRLGVCGFRFRHCEEAEGRRGNPEKPGASLDCRVGFAASQ